MRKFILTVLIFLFAIKVQSTILLSNEEFYHTIPAPRFHRENMRIRENSASKWQTPLETFSEGIGSETILGYPINESQYTTTDQYYEYGDFLLNFQSNLPEECRLAVLRAISILSDVLMDVIVKISVDVEWTQLATGVLASAGPKYIYLNQQDGLYYTSALANQDSGADMNPGFSDILVSINSGVSNWYYGTNDTEIMPSGTYDMVTAVLHELIHGLGWVGLIKSDGSYGGDGSHLYRYDNALVLKQTGVHLLNGFPIDKTIVKASFGDTLNFDASSDSKWVIYNPSPFKSGSSIYHLDEDTYPDGNENSLMTPVLKSRQRIRSPGPASLSVLQYLGWTVRDCSHYSSSCNTCTSALCYWCGNGMCLPSMPSSSYETCSISCPSCNKDSDCQDPTNLCVIGSCSGYQTTSSCSYSRVDCGNGKYCDSLRGCISTSIQSATPTVTQTPTKLFSPTNAPTKIITTSSSGTRPSVCTPSYASVVLSANPTGSRNFNSVDGTQLIIPYINPILKSSSIPSLVDLQQYGSWSISDISLNIILDKVDNFCLIPTHSSVKPNELIIQLLIKPSVTTPSSSGINETLTAIAKQSFTKFSTFLGPYNWTFTTIEGSSSGGILLNKISTQSPKNGTYKSFQRADQIFSSSSSNSNLPDNKFGALQWWLIFADSTLGNPSCFYGSKLRLDLIKPVDPLSLPVGILCKSTWVLLTKYDMISLSLAIPANFFGAGSKAVNVNSVKLCDCKNKNSPEFQIAFDTTDDLSISPSDRSSVYNIGVKISSLNLCSTGNITLINGKGQKQSKSFSVRIDGFSPDPQSSGSLIINQQTGTFSFDAKVRVSLIFPPSDYLWYDNPPGYLSPFASIKKTGQWNIQNFSRSKSL